MSSRHRNRVTAVQRTRADDPGLLTASQASLLVAHYELTMAARYTGLPKTTAS